MKVAVVGAGIAGLSAAYDLLKAGADVTVLESERRAG
ncbi:MAG: FAD-dependent oxidoreductase, partial [Gemmatimonadetes bacterium]|nr:FAD-dependent oxidoreductase [Gemmatimonadota bacterium]